MAPDPAPKPAIHFSFFSKASYYHRLAEEMARTKRGGRIFLVTMAFRPTEEGVPQLLAELHAAAQRGVTVNLAVDAISLIVTQGVIPGPLLFSRTLPRHIPKLFQPFIDALNELAQSGVRYTILNWPHRPLTNPFAGRSHIKFAVIDDHIFVGGCNITKINDIDLMAGWSDAAIADWFCAFGQKIMASGSVLQAMAGHDETISLDGSTNLLIDAGVPGQSLILDTALSLIDTAEKHIMMTCQYPPNDVTARHLTNAADRGVSVELIYNHPGKHYFPLSLLHHGVLWFEKSRKPAWLFAGQLPKRSEFLHAKLLVTDKGAMVGSHNYVRAGVTFGTAEMALLSSSQPFGELALDVLRHQL